MIRFLYLAAMLLIWSGWSDANAAQQPGESTPGQGSDTMAISDDKHSTVAGGRPVVLLGASYAEGLKLAQLAGRALVNKGVGGEESGGMLDRFQTDVVDVDPEMVILWGFINDIFRSDRAKMADTITKVKNNYMAMVALARENGIVPVLVTEITMSRRPGVKERVMDWVAGVMGKTSYQDFINGHVMEVNRWMKEYAEQNGLKLLDFQALLAEGGVMRVMTNAQADGSHVSERGYALIADYLSKQF